MKYLMGIIAILATVCFVQAKDRIVVRDGSGVVERDWVSSQHFGTIFKLTGNTVVLKIASGAETDIRVDDATLVFIKSKDKTEVAAKFTDLKVGQKVEITPAREVGLAKKIDILPSK